MGLGASGAVGPGTPLDLVNVLLQRQQQRDTPIQHGAYERGQVKAEILSGRNIEWSWQRSICTARAKGFGRSARVKCTHSKPTLSTRPPLNEGEARWRLARPAASVRPRLQRPQPLYNHRAIGTEAKMAMQVSVSRRSQDAGEAQHTLVELRGAHGSGGDQRKEGPHGGASTCGTWVTRLTSVFRLALSACGTWGLESAAEFDAGRRQRRLGHVKFWQALSRAVGWAED